MANDIELKADKEEENARLWSDLPVDALCSILVCLPTADCRSFRFSCKSWRSTPAVARPFPPPFDFLLADSPCLVSFNGFTLFRFWNPKQNYTYQVDLRRFPYADVRGSGSNGWLLMTSPYDYCPNPRSVYLFNPITRSMFRPPTIPEFLKFRRQCLTSEPQLGSSNCSIFGISEPKLGSIQIGMVSYGERHWTVDQFRSTFKVSSNPRFHSGRYYCLDKAGNIGEFDPAKHSWNVHPTSLQQHLQPECKYKLFLVTTEEEVLLVVFVSVLKDVSIFKLDFSNMVWHEISCLGGKALYVSEMGCLATLAATVERGNKVYYSAANALGQCFTYSFDTRTWETVHEAYCYHEHCMSSYNIWIQSSQEIV